jgi:antitoxin component YwqK of YwqJK toxin-antitoxin module
MRTEFLNLPAMNCKIYTLLLLLGLPALVFAQPGKNDLANQVPAIPKYDASIVDETYGIRLYEPLNMSLQGDSVRLCQGYACQGWVEDHYESGTLLHKGYYLDGQLKVYKNYYPDGILEREFKAIDAYRCQMKLYHPNGLLKSDIKYQDGAPLVWTDYHSNGKMSYYEEYGKSQTWHVAKRAYFEDGSPEFLLELADKKKLTYSRKEYHKPNVLKAEGEMAFNEGIMDYVKTGKWVYYNESGTAVREEIYQAGSVVKEKTY